MTVNELVSRFFLFVFSSRQNRIRVQRAIPIKIKMRYKSTLYQRYYIIEKWDIMLRHYFNEQVPAGSTSSFINYRYIRHTERLRVFLLRRR